MCTFVPLHRKSTNLTAEVPRCLPVNNAFGQRQPYELSPVLLLLSVTPNSSLSLALWHAFLPATPTFLPASVISSGRVGPNSLDRRHRNCSPAREASLSSLQLSPPAHAASRRGREHKGGQTKEKSVYF